MLYVIIGISTLVFGLLAIFIPVYFQSKNLKRGEILEVLKEEYVKSSPYTADQDKIRKEIAGMKRSELMAKVKNDLEGYLDRRKEGGHDLSRFELKHERRLKELLEEYKNA